MSVLSRKNEHACALDRIRPDELMFLKILKERQHEHTGECRQREAMLQAQRDEFSSIIQVKRKKPTAR
jgi:hypothetical protein